VALDEALLAADLGARRAALDTQRSFIVQAPAGSGKTELLIQRYLKLLSTVDQPEEVVAITFTRKAAQEMQLRVLRAMRDAARGLTSDEAHTRITLDAAGKVLERDRENGWKLLDAPRRMRVQTLDALNAGIARSLPFSAGLGSTGRIAADDELMHLYRRAASGTLDFLLTEGAANDAVEQVLAHLDNNTTAYISYIAQMLAKRDQWLQMTGAGTAGSALHSSVRQKLEKNIANEVSARLAQVRQLLPNEHLPLLAELCRYAGDNLGAEQGSYSALTECETFPYADARCLGQWRAVAGLLLTQSGSWRKTVNRKDGFPARDGGQKRRMLDLLQLLGEHEGLAAELHSVRRLPEPCYTDAQWAVLRALIRLLPLAVSELRRLFGEIGVTDYTEVALAASAALGDADAPGDVGLLLDCTIRHLLIDEMQDTSVSQYRLIEKLVAGWEPGDGRTLFCVGDPMQSIYRFRDAEVGQFLLAREHGIGPVTLESLVLRRNFRSGEHLVHWFNEVFRQILPERDDIGAGAISYAASVPVENLRRQGEHHVHPLFGATFEEEAAIAVDVIRRSVDASPDQSTAVLVRSRTQLPTLLARLREARVPYHAVEIDRLTDLPEIIDLVALTRAISHMGDRIAWLGLLRGPWVGLAWEDLHALVLNDRDSTIWELLHDDERIRGLSQQAEAAVRWFADVMSPFVAGHGTKSLRDVVEQAWYCLRGPLLLENDEEVDNIYRFFDVLDAIDAAGTLQDVAELEARLDQERVSAKATSGCRLHVMTIHKAKGLEFDHVVLHGLGRMTRSDEKSILSWLNLPDAEDGPAMIISPVGARADLERDPLHNFIEAADRQKGRLELDRLLYVACTRARRTVHLIGHVPLSANDRELCEPRKDTLLESLWPAISAQFAKALRVAGAARQASRAARTEAEMFSFPVLRRLRPGVEMPPVPPLPGFASTAQPAPDHRVDFYWVGSIARHAGTILHRWLHRIAAGTMPGEIGDSEQLLPAARNLAKELGVPMRDVDDVCDRALLALRGILGDEKGRWILYGPGSAELAVTGVWHDRVESIVIDRVRIDDAGVHWIIDYKASTHEGSGLETFLQQESERYRRQLERYAALYRNLLDDPGIPVHTALYFPLLRQFREVPIDRS
jgi:ATP-dependent helicase/nuclease subunit A